MAPDKTNTTLTAYNHQADIFLLVVSVQSYESNRVYIAI